MTAQSMTPGFDIIVIGAGAVGAAAAYHLAKDGVSVLLLEQFEIGHTRGSSHGGSRIVRYTHDTTAYAQAMPETFALWRELEQESGATLLQMAGGLYMGPPDRGFVADAQHALRNLDFPFELYTPTELPRVYPQFRIPPEWVALYQEHSGILAASRCVETLVRRAVHHGAALHERTRVTGVRPQATFDAGVEVATEGPQGERTFQAGQVIICPGAWATQFLGAWFPQDEGQNEDQDEDVPANVQLEALRVTHQQVVYYPVADAAAYAPGRFPVFVCAGENFIYGLPAWERPQAIKVSLEQEERTVDPDQAERPVDPHLLESLNHGVAYYLPGVEPTPVHVDTCLYTETPSRDFIIDRHPRFSQMLIAAGFSGRGFKHTIAIGRLLADLAQCAPGVYPQNFWLDAFRLDRHRVQATVAAPQST